MAGGLLRTFPISPGSSRWGVQNIGKRTEYEVDVEQMTCNCPRFEFKRSCKHLTYALYRCKLYSGDREAYEQFLERGAQ